MGGIGFWMLSRLNGAAVLLKNVDIAPAAAREDDPLENLKKPEIESPLRRPSRT
jgi:hypothetical protein